MDPQLIAAIKNNPRLQQEAARLKKMGVNVGSVVDSTVKEWQESEANRAVRPSSYTSEDLLINHENS